MCVFVYVWWRFNLSSRVDALLGLPLVFTIHIANALSDFCFRLPPLSYLGCSLNCWAPSDVLNKQCKFQVISLSIIGWINTRLIIINLWNMLESFSLANSFIYVHLCSMSKSELATLGHKRTDKVNIKLLSLHVKHILLYFYLPWLLIITFLVKSSSIFKAD